MRSAFGRRAPLRQTLNAAPTGGLCGWRKWWVLLGPVPAVLLGAFVMRRHGIKADIWGQNVGVWLLCSILLIAYGGSARNSWGSRQMRLGLLGSALLMAGLPLCFSGLDGVFRWIVIGGVRVHPASFAIPLFLMVFRTAERESGSWITWLLALALGALLIAQPDAAEATGFFLAVFVFFILKEEKKAVRAVGGAVLCLLLICAWFRTDPLGAIPHVEGIVGLAFALNAVLGFAAIASLVLAVSPIVITARCSSNPDECATATALSIYFVGIILATISGRFPVPLLGYGASGIIGYCIALAWVLQPRPAWVRDAACFN